MKIGGLQKTTLIDFPGRVACTVFTVGCNFRCPFCHNRELVTEKEWDKSGRELVSEEDFWKFLEKRKKVLDGVCITGGEPTLQLDLIEFCQKIKKLGLKVKLDTNGGRPEVLKKILEDNLVNYVAMDIKIDAGGYKIVGGNAEAVKKSLEILKNSGVGYELRTTVIPRIHSEEVLINMAKWIKDVDRWIWQKFVGRNCWDKAWEKEKSYSKGEITKLRSKISREIGLRGW